MITRILVIFFIIAAMMMPSFVGNSFAQTQKKHLLTYALVQITVRNTAGQLVVYLEAKDSQFLDPDILNKFLDAQNATGTISSSGTKFQIFQFTIPFVGDRIGSTSHADLLLQSANKQFYTLRVLTDGFWYTYGDKITNYWTIVRTG